jgi:hypothetical protein
MFEIRCTVHLLRVCPLARVQASHGALGILTAATTIIGRDLHMRAAQDMGSKRMMQ